jgi:Uma2 family endonuclease
MLPQFRGKPCSAFFAPLDVRFDDENCTEPDLLIVCDERQIKRTHIEGAPKLIVEIISDFSVTRDRVRKMRLYARFGVEEVWLVTPWPPIVEVFALDGKSFRLGGAYRKEDAFRSPAFPDLRLDLSRVFDFPPEPGDVIEVIKEPPVSYGRK